MTPLEPVARDLDPPDPPKSLPAWVRWALAAGAIVLIGGGFFGAKALSHKSNAAAATVAPTAAGTGNGSGGGSPGGPGGQPGTSGTIASISGNALTVKNAAAGTTVKVVTSGSTRVTASATVAVAAIVKGDHILVTGTTSGSVVTATRVADLGASTTNFSSRGAGAPPSREGGAGGANAPPAGGEGGAGFGPPGGGNGTGANGGGGFTAGTVGSVTADSIVVVETDGTAVTVKTSASTVVTKDIAGSVSALKVGDTVRVNGTAASDGTVTAASISEGDTGGFGGFGRGANGAPAGAGA